jgi:hypothetical protein
MSEKCFPFVSGEYDSAGRELSGDWGELRTDELQGLCTSVWCPTSNERSFINWFH